MTTVPIFLEALDVLFFRDGRPFGAAAHGTSGLPAPQTLIGALRTALLEAAGCNFERLRGHGDFAAAVAAACPAEYHAIARVAVRGPWLARRPGGAAAPVEPLVPVPATLHTPKKPADGAVCCLAPLRAGTQLPGWTPIEAGLRPLWLKQAVTTKPAEGYLTLAGLDAFLNNEPVPATAIVSRTNLYEFDHRTGIGVDPDRLSAQESLIYGASFLALAKDTGLYAEVNLPDQRVRKLFEGVKTFAFGGEGRRVRLEVLGQPVGWPRPRRTGKPCLLLTTPALLQQRWRPAQLPGLVAAAVPGAVAVSGWDLARRGPKPTRFAAAAGSVYFLEGPVDGLPVESLSDHPDDRQAGWGCYLKGVWSDA